MKKERSKTWGVFSGLLEKLTSRVSKSEQDLSLHEERLKELETGKSPSIDPFSTHELEVQEEERVEAQDVRRASLSDSELQKDLEKEYGSTRWAKRFIQKIIFMR